MSSHEKFDVIYVSPSHITEEVYLC